MNVVTAAPAAAPRPRGASAAPAAHDDFAALLAGLGSPEPTPAAAPEGLADAAATGRPLPDESDQHQPGSAAGPLPAVPVPTPAAGLVAPAVVVPAVAPAIVEGRAGDTGRPTVAVAPAASAAATAVQGAPVEAGTAQASAAPAGTAPVTTATAQPAVLQTVTGGGAPAPRTTTAGPAAPSAPGLPVLPATAAVDAGTVAAATSSMPATTSVPDAVQLSVPAEVAGDSPVPALDVRPTASAGGPVAGAQTAGTAVVEAMLPTGTAAGPLAAAPVDVAVDLPRPDAAPTAAPAPAGAEAGVAAPQPTDLRASAPAAPAAPPPPPPPAAQVVQLLSPVLAGPDGSYSLSLQLYPEELGAVQVEVLLRGNEIRLVLHAPDEAAQAALRSALPDLRADLQAGGLSATSLSVDDGRSGQSSLDRHGDRSPDGRPDGQGDSPGRRAHPYRGAEPAPRPPTSNSDAALDLRM